MWNANPNPLRSLIIDPVLSVQEGMIALPEGPGLGVVPDVPQFEPYVTVRTSRQT